MTQPVKPFIVAVVSGTLTIKRFETRTEADRFAATLRPGHFWVIEHKINADGSHVFDCPETPPEDVMGHARGYTMPGDDPRTVKGPCFDECRNGIQEVRSPGFLDFYMECGCTYEGVTVPTPKLDPETRPNVPPRMMA